MSTLLKLPLELIPINPALFSKLNYEFPTDVGTSFLIVTLSSFPKDDTSQDYFCSASSFTSFPSFNSLSNYVYIVQLYTISSPVNLLSFIANRLFS
jgi:hypothetical protein